MLYYGLLLFQKQGRFVHSISCVFERQMFSVNLCSNFNTLGWIADSVADCFFPLFPTGHGLVAVMIVYKGALALLAEPPHVILPPFNICIRGGQRKVWMTI